MSCTAIQVVSGDSCTSLVAECGISTADFYEYNPSSTLCSTLAVGQYVCCSSGSLPDYSPQPYANGTCYTYLVQEGDSCSDIAATYTITVADILDYNDETWGWLGCGTDELMADTNICLSSGTPPFPASVSGATCGPQVPGTTPTSDADSWASMNPCPLNACCDKWGQCGITPDFCTVTNSTTGNPGTAAAGTNGCISNCGFEWGDGSQTETWFNIGYFEAFNEGRSCLNMYPENIDTANYTHIYFAFGNITSDYEIDISGAIDMFEGFVGLDGVQRVVSFGGWDFSTDPSTYMIFREGVTEDNRDTLVSNIVKFVNEFGLDGVDFDWEYPGEPDIPGIPAGSTDDGTNYLAFLKALKAALPDTVSVSIAAPASYWYLKEFPIEEIADVVDWIIYMTYDLHGVWDLDNDSAQSGCSDGNCLRSHVNRTETYYALSMITKAGVPSSQVMVGVASYGRSFTMTTAGCTTEDCTWTAGGDAGPCTDTVGYISNAEINQIISENPTATQLYDDESDTNILVYNDTQWVGYMTYETKVERAALYQEWSFGGTTEWAVDLESYVDFDLDSWEPIGKLKGEVVEPVCTNSNASYWRCIECVNTTLASNIIYQLIDSDRWAMSYTDDAVTDMINWWNSDPLEGESVAYAGTWTSAMAQYLGYITDYDCSGYGTDSTICDTDLSCSGSADDTLPLASIWILNTMARMRAFYSNWYSALEDNLSDLEGISTTFKDTFAPDESETLGEEIVDFILDQLLGAAGAAIWSKVGVSLVDKLVAEEASEDVKDAASDAWDSVWEVVSDDVEDALSVSSTVPSLSDIQTYITTAVDAQMEALNSSYASLISGTADSQKKWQSATGNGTWLSIGDGVSMPDLVGTIKKQLMANVLSYAWNVTDSYVPVIIMTDVQDDTSNPFKSDLSETTELSDDDAAASRYSIAGSGKTFWLVGANACNSRVDNQYIGYGCDDPTTKFRALPGLTALNGTYEWGNLTFSELIVSSYGGYVLNDNANGYDLQNSADGSYYTDGSGTKGTVPWTAGVETPGVFQVPMCNFSVAFYNQVAVQWQLSPVSAPTGYPCSLSCEDLGLSGSDGTFDDCFADD